jgi:hypothetical protein
MSPLGGKKVSQNYFLCNNVGPEIIERPNGYDGKHVICPTCTHYKISRNGVNKFIHGYKVPASLSDKVRNHFEKTGERYAINTINLSLL